MSQTDVKRIVQKMNGLEIMTVGPFERYNFESYKAVVQFYTRVTQSNNKMVNYQGRRLMIFDHFTILPNYKTSVMVSKLPHNSVLEDDLYQHFIQFGEIQWIVRHTFNVKNAAIITFQDEKSADAAVKCKTFEFKDRFTCDEKYEIKVEKSIGLCCKYTKCSL